MAGALKEKQLAREMYNLLQAASCPLMEGLFLQDEDSMLHLLCSPSQYRTDILAWICKSINPNFLSCKSSSVNPKDPDTLTIEIALFGQELMLCKATDLDLIRGLQSPERQLAFLKQLLSLLPCPPCPKAEVRCDEEFLLNELFSPETLPQLTLMLHPTANPWPAHVTSLQKGCRPQRWSKDDHVDLESLLLSTQTALEQLQSQCEFLKSPQSSGPFCSSALRVAALDLQQMMSAFSHIYHTDLKSYCNRAPPAFSPESSVFKRVHELMTKCNTELEILHELSETSGVMTEEVRRLRTEPRYWNKGEKHTLPEQLEELTRRYREFLTLLNT
ncbi:unnamed protein product [Knipowitschia caucasica]